MNIIKLKALLLVTLLSTATLFAGFQTVDCTNQTHLDTLKLPQVECEILDAFWDAMGNGIGWTDATGWDTLTYADTWSGVYMHDDNSSIKWLGWGVHGNGLSGELPNEIGNFLNLVSLFLYHNNISGEVPLSIDNLTALETLALEGNQLNGSLPKLSLSSNIYYLNLIDNQFTGRIPSSYANLTKLTDLLVTKNQLSGPIPDLSELSVLEDFRIKYNNFTFSNIELQINNIKDLQHITYRDQADINETAHIIYFSDTLRIEPRLDANPSKHDYYIWKKDAVTLEDTRVYTNEDFSQSRIYVKENATPEDAGCYSYDVNNSRVTLPNSSGVFRNLVLHSNTCIQVEYNRAPVVSNLLEVHIEVQADTAYSYTPEASDPDGDALSFSIATTPSWTNFEPSTGELSGTPTNANIGRYDINITVTDGKTPTYISYTIEVLPKDIAPVDTGYRHIVTNNTLLSILLPQLTLHTDQSNERVYFIENDTCQGSYGAYIALAYTGALYTAFENCTDASHSQTLESSSPYPNGSKATLILEPGTTKAMIMIDIPLTDAMPSVTIGGN